MEENEIISMATIMDSSPLNVVLEEINMIVYQTKEENQIINHKIPDYILQSVQCALQLLKVVQKYMLNTRNAAIKSCNSQLTFNKMNKQPILPNTKIYKRIRCKKKLLNNLCKPLACNKLPIIIKCLEGINYPCIINHIQKPNTLPEDKICPYVSSHEEKPISNLDEHNVVFCLILCIPFLTIQERITKFVFLCRELQMAVLNDSMIYALDFCSQSIEDEILWMPLFTKYIMSTLSRRLKYIQLDCLEHLLLAGSLGNSLESISLTNIPAYMHGSFLFTTQLPTIVSAVKNVFYSENKDITKSINMLQSLKQLAGWLLTLAQRCENLQEIYLSFSYDLPFTMSYIEPYNPRRIQFGNEELSHIEANHNDHRNQFNLQTYNNMNTINNNRNPNVNNNSNTNINTNTNDASASRRVNVLVGNSPIYIQRLTTSNNEETPPVKQLPVKYTNSFNATGKQPEKYIDVESPNTHNNQSSIRLVLSFYKRFISIPFLSKHENTKTSSTHLLELFCKYSKPSTIIYTQVSSLYINHISSAMPLTLLLGTSFPNLRRLSVSTTAACSTINFLDFLEFFGRLCLPNKSLFHTLELCINSNAAIPKFLDTLINFKNIKNFKLSSSNTFGRNVIFMHEEIENLQLVAHSQLSWKIKCPKLKTLNLIMLSSNLPDENTILDYLSVPETLSHILPISPLFSRLTVMNCKHSLIFQIDGRPELLRTSQITSF